MTVAWPCVVVIHKTQILHSPASAKAWACLNFDQNTTTTHHYHYRLQNSISQVILRQFKAILLKKVIPIANSNSFGNKRLPRLPP